MLDQARAEAQRLHSDAVGTGHLVLGLLRFGVVEAVLRELGVDPQAVRVAVEAGLGANSDPDDRTATSEEWSRTPRAREVWELAFGELQDLYWVGPESVLLGVLRHGNNLAAEALHSVGITSYDQVQIATMKVIDEQGIAHMQYDPYQR